MTSPDASSSVQASSVSLKRGRKRTLDCHSEHVVQPHKSALLKRLNRIEGQVRGISGMIEQDRYCIDILTQISAIHSALGAVSMQLLEDHTRGCVQAAIRSGRGQHAIDELMQVARRLSR